MIYTRAQLDEVIEAAERMGWGGCPAHRGTDAVCVYRGYGVIPLHSVVPLRDGWVIRFTRSSQLEPEKVWLAPWLVDELREVSEAESERRKHAAPPNYQGIADRLAEAAHRECAAGPWKAWPENKPPLTTKTEKYLVRLAHRIEIARYLHGDEVFTTEGFLHLSGVTHFAELNTEGAP